ncbi:unnamed protein product [Lactuca virosa]|uniref:Uncharacterized protein n=1 Tax=Lactuca virosa TaxID=75947 RepID=A0AAU9MLT6_9ASTR|nr:unnamed protein product [Lactuca virosa]
MHLFRIDDISQNVYSVVDRRDYLRIDHQNTWLLGLSNPVHKTIWRLRSNLGVPMPEPGSNSDKDDHIPNASIPDFVAPVKQDPVMHPYHDMYMQKFQRLYEDNRHLHRDYSKLYDSACEINTEMV